MRRGFLLKVGAIVVGGALVVLGPLLLLAKTGGPYVTSESLVGGLPATFYGPPPSGIEKSAPGVVVAHGYSGDRATMSALSRGLARAGYAVLAIDFRGHGSNPNASDEEGRSDDVVAALEWLGSRPEVDAGSLALLGHSMGGHAVLDVARRDERVGATVVLGASGSTAGAREVLFLFGEWESAPGEVERIEGANHITILWFDETVERSVAWLDRAFDVQRNDDPGIDDPRLGFGLAYFVAAVLALPFLGSMAGRIVRRVPDEPPATMRDAVLVAAALAAAVPVGSLLDPAGFLGAGYGEVVSSLAIAGVLLFLLRLRPRGSVEDRGECALRTALGSAAALAGAFVLFVPLDGVVHTLVPTSRRLVLACVMTPLLAVFFVQVQALLRRGAVWRATLGSIASHGAVLVALAAGVVLGLFPGVVALALPLLAGVFGLVEAFGIGAYARTRSGAFVGLVEALWVAGIAAVAMPLPG